MREVDLSAWWPALARPEEQLALQAFASGSRGVLLCGESGVGKTYLARQVQAAISESGRHDLLWLTVTGTHFDSGIPLGAVEELIDGLNIGPGDSPRRIASIVAAGLRARAGGKRVVVLIDDVQLLDGASAQLLANLCRLEGFELLATKRSPIEGSGEFSDLWREEIITRIDVAPLRTHHVNELLHSCLGGTIDAELVHEIERATGGNVLFIRELVRSGLAAGVIVQRRGLWTWDGPPRADARLMDLISAELQRLDGAQRQAVELIALAEPVPLAVVRDHIETEVLDQLIASEIIKLDRGVPPNRQAPRRAGLTLAHPLYAESVRSVISPGRGQELYLKLYGSLPSPPELTMSGLLRWTAWTRECGLSVEPALLLRAARTASALGNWSYAIEMASAAIELEEIADEERIAAWELRSWELRFRGRFIEALHDVDAAIALRGSHDEGDRQDFIDSYLRLHLLRADIEQYGFDQPDKALETIGAAFDYVVEELGGADRVGEREFIQLIRRAWAGDFVPARARADELLSRTAPTSSSLLQTVAPSMLACVWDGDIGRARALAEKYWPAAMAEVENQPWIAAEISSAHFMSELLAGEVERSAEIEVPDLLSSRPIARIDFALVQAGQGRLLAAMGQWREADEALRGARKAFAIRDPSGFRAWTTACEAFTAVMVGDRQRAETLSASIERLPLGTSRALLGDIWIFQILVAIGLGDGSATRRAETLAAWAAQAGQSLTELKALQLLAVADPTAAAASGAIRRVHSLIRDKDAPIMFVLAEHLEALLNGDSVVGAAVQGRLAELGHWLPKIGGSLVLSQRELEVATLVAAGLSTKVIAERLHLSARTVESHLARLFTKLGVNRRTQVAMAMQRHGHWPGATS